MSVVPDETPGGSHYPRDILSRAVMQSDKCLLFLESDRWQQTDGAHSGLRSYAIGLAKLVLHLVENSAAADAEGFDVILSAVTFVTAELAQVMAELLEL
ncbi:MAG: hypothetical protein JWL69_1061 [Phycisphaerales bacterium]|nr:hypothetical protein [Phycisphaerales bacterium]MDB5357302.1 hypothetical protein [Phycisphaerales bacterium]